MTRRSDIKKEQLLQFIVRHCNEAGIYKASVEAIIKGLGFGSTPTIKKYLDDLEQDGKIRVINGRPAAYQVVGSVPKALPVVGNVELDENIIAQINALAGSLPQIATVLKSLYREVDELRQFVSSLNEIHRTPHEVLYKRDIVKDAEEQPQPAEVQYGA